MLSYAFQVLKQSNYEEIKSEKFDRVQDLFAAIISKGAAQQLKQGLYREYIQKSEVLPVLRGKLDISRTIQERIQRKPKMACEFDELSENNLFNQIIKTTLYYLVKDENVTNERKISLKKILVFLDRIDLLEPKSIKWSTLYYQRNNSNYEMLINICYFVLDGMLQTTENGDYKMMGFSDEHMDRLYEKFILEYYRQNHSYLSECKSAEVKWNLTGENDESLVKFLPSMQTDVFLRFKEKVLIIDAKYYSETMQRNYDKYSLRSAHMYQIFAYVKNQDKYQTGNVAGLLLYAKTDETVVPDCDFNIGGNQIGAKTLDLNTDFHTISSQLDKIADKYL